MKDESEIRNHLPTTGREIVKQKKESSRLVFLYSFILIPCFASLWLNSYISSIIKRRVQKWQLTLLITLFLQGCGFYSMAGSIPPHIRSIAIPLLDNQTAEYGISEDITDNLLEIFTEENILRVVDDENADSILRGTIIKAEDAPYTFSKEEAVSEYRFTVTLDMEWFDVKNEEVLLKKRYSGWGAYGLTGDISTDGIDNDGDGLIDAEDDDELGEPRTFAIKVAVGKIAQDILNEIMTSW